jgi:hypothetical protein
MEMIKNYYLTEVLLLCNHLLTTAIIMIEDYNAICYYFTFVHY